jgi:hypothetical protein
MITFAPLPKNRTAIVSFGHRQIGPYCWVGHCKNGIVYYAGQTFKSPAEGILKRIKLFSSVVYGSTTATLSVYDFDETTYSWKSKKAEASRSINKAEENQWITFEIPNFEIKNDEVFGFKIACSGAGMLAIAECPWNTPNPYAHGVEWIGSSIAKDGSFYKDFDLAFEAEVETLSYTKLF